MTGFPSLFPLCINRVSLVIHPLMASMLILYLSYFDNALINMTVKIPFDIWNSIPLDINTEVELLDHMIDQVLVS